MHVPKDLIFQCLILVSRFACGILNYSACADTHNSLKYEIFLCIFFFITWLFLILVPDLRNFLLDTRIYIPIVYFSVQFFIFETKEENDKPIWIHFLNLVYWTKKAQIFVCGWKNLRCHCSSISPTVEVRKSQSQIFPQFSLASDFVQSLCVTSVPAKLPTSVSIKHQNLSSMELNSFSCLQHKG